MSPSSSFFKLIRFSEALSQIALQICQCTTAPTALLNRGYMACAPTHPTLAVDLKLLEFSRLQFLHMVPNSTGWCAALEAFLTSLGFKLRTRVSPSLQSFINVPDCLLRIACAADLPTHYVGIMSYATRRKSGSRISWTRHVGSHAPLRLIPYPAPLRHYLLHLHLRLRHLPLDPHSRVHR